MAVACGGCIGAVRPAYILYITEQSMFDKKTLTSQKHVKLLLKPFE